MPPAISDDESVGHVSPQVERFASCDSGDDEFPASKDKTPVTNGKAKGNGKGKAAPESEDEEEEDQASEKGNDDEDEDGSEDEEVYQVEKIIKHDWTQQNARSKWQVLYRVKWLGYDAVNDQTWEPKENLTGAQDMLDAYHEAIGGEPEPPSTKAAASKRTSTGARSKRARDPTPDEPAPKRTKRASRAKSEDNDDEDNDEDEDDKDNKQYSATQRQQDQKVREFLKTEVDWEKKVKYVHSVEHRKSDDPKKPKNGRLVVAIAFDDGTRDGLKTLVLMRAARERCPQRLLDYYEQHLTWKEDTV